MAKRRLYNYRTQAYDELEQFTDWKDYIPQDDNAQTVFVLRQEVLGETPMEAALRVLELTLHTPYSATREERIVTDEETARRLAMMLEAADRRAEQIMQQARDRAAAQQAERDRAAEAQAKAEENRKGNES